MSTFNPVYRATVVYSNSATGQITVRIPSLAGADSTFDISYIGRAAINGVWAVPSIGEQIVVTADDPNFTNTFWVQTNQVRGPAGANGDWTTPQIIKPITTTTYTPITSDAGKLVTLSNASEITVTVGFSLGLTKGQRIDFLAIDNCLLTRPVRFTTSGTSLYYTPTEYLRTRWSSATLICLDAAPNTPTYVLVGDLSA